MILRIQGQMIASIPDIMRMKANTYINEAEFKKVKPGMKVVVRLDALPSVAFDGIIKEISKICFTRDREKVFNVVVEILGSDLRLKPGMTVSCEYIIYETDKEMFVPNSCLLKEKGRSYVLPEKGVVLPVNWKLNPDLPTVTITIVSGNLKPGQKLMTLANVSSPLK